MQYVIKIEMDRVRRNNKVRKNAEEFDGNRNNRDKEHGETKEEWIQNVE